MMGGTGSRAARSGQSHICGMDQWPMKVPRAGHSHHGLLLEGDAKRGPVQGMSSGVSVQTGRQNLLDELTGSGLGEGLREAVAEEKLHTACG